MLLWGSLHFDGSDGKKHGKSTVFLESCWKTEHSPANCTIFAVLRWFPAISTSPTENWCLVCCYHILLIKCAIYIRPWVDLEVPFISTAPMAANMENPRFSWKAAEKRSIHWQIARFSRFCGGFQQFRHLQRKMGAWFSVMPRMDFGVLSISMAQMAGNTENPRFSWKIAGKLRIHARFSRFCWLPAISTSPTENWCLVFCYQILLIKCAIYIRQRVDLGVPPFQRLRWQETRKIHGFLEKIAERRSIHRQIARFSRFCWFPAISTSPTENWCLVCCYQILLIKCAIYIRPRVDLGVPPISTAPMAKNTENP